MVLKPEDQYRKTNDFDNDIGKPMKSYRLKTFLLSLVVLFEIGSHVAQDNFQLTTSLNN